MKCAKYLAALMGAAIMSSCLSFDEINTNPDASTNVNSSLLATGAIADIMKSSGGAGFVDHLFISKYLAWGEGARGNQYNDFYRTSFGGYTSLVDYVTMASLAPESTKDAYEGLALFLKAYRLFDMTLSVGDIPYTEILNGKDGVFTPKYDKQKDVCLYLIKDLEEAYAKMKNASDFDGDIVFNGSSSQWAKVITAFQLRLLLNLSIKETDPDLKVAQRFKEVYKNGSLMESNADNLQLVYSDKADQMYPYHESGNKHWAYAILSDFLVDMLKENEDYRLFYYGSPCAVKLSEGIPEGSWDAFVGVDPTNPVDDIRKSWATQNYSGLNTRYVTYVPGEPFIRLGYAEQKFILAEAALRGWIDADAEQLYKEGIAANMSFIKEYTPDDVKYHYGNPITDSYIEDFVNRPSVALDGDFEAKLEKIMTQKYIASFMQLPWQPYYDYRRTGYPKFPINPETSLNFNAPDKLPVRWQYPDSEISYNKENVEEAIRSQYGGADEVNKLMWILQKD